MATNQLSPASCSYISETLGPPKPFQTKLKWGRLTVSVQSGDPSSVLWGFPGSSAGKESTCNAGEPGSIPGSGRSPGEGIGYPLQYS